MRKQTLITTTIIAVIIIILGVSVLNMIGKDEDKEEEQNTEQTQDLENATTLLNESKPDEALDIIYNYKEKIETLSENGKQWLALFIEAAKQTKDRPQLTLLFEFYPEIFSTHEEAAWLVADSYLTDNNLKDYEKVRSQWSDRETKYPAWFVLDADALLLQDRRDDAVALLKSRSFKGDDDIGRLVRLALLYNDTEPKTAWQYLLQANAINPNNPDIRYYRAKVLESAGKNSMAHKEYLAAAKLQPANVYLQDELADFYLRQRHYPKATKIWEENLPPPSSDKMWVKALFWNRVTTPLNIDWKNTPMPEGNLYPLIRYLEDLTPDEFWNEEKFNQIVEHKYLLETQQATFWLRLLHALKTNKEGQALQLLQYNPFATTSWNPELELALKRILIYRTSNSFKGTATHTSIDSSRQPPLFAQLDEFASSTNNKKIPEDLKELLLSQEAFSAIFIAAGWNEAGIQLHALPIYPAEFPSWAVYNMTLALKQNRSDTEALEFATMQPSTPELSLLIAELMATTGDSDAALQKLTPLATTSNALGFRSAWLASLLYIEKQNYPNAKEVILTQPRLAKSVLGQEVLARIAHLEGDKQQADKLYQAIEKHSKEARSYLANKAFAEGNWQKARELTEQLVKDEPENKTLKKNLLIIIEEQQRSGLTTP